MKLIDSWIGQKCLDWYRRVMYHHDYLFTSVLLMIIHAILCTLPSIFTPQAICPDNILIISVANTEQLLRWLYLTIFSAIPLLLDIAFDYFKSTAQTVERNQWIARIIMFIALIIPGTILMLLKYYHSTEHTQCLVIAALIPSQSMVLVSSIFCTMFYKHNYIASEENEKNKFSIEKRAIALMVHLTLSRLIIFLYYLSKRNNGLYITTIIINITVFLHILYVLVRYIYVLLRDRIDGEFQTAQALSNFLYTFAALIFLLLGSVVIVILQMTGIIHTDPDLASIHLSIHRLIFMVCFALFISVIPGRVGMYAAKLEHRKLQTRLNLIRYVSHEMRSPLNTAFLGLEFVTTELNRMHTEYINHYQHSHIQNHSSYYHNMSNYSSTNNSTRGNGNPIATSYGKGTETVLEAPTAIAEGAALHNIVAHAGVLEGLSRSNSPILGVPNNPQVSLHNNIQDKHSTGAYCTSTMPISDTFSNKSLNSSNTSATATKSIVSEVLDIVKQINTSCNIALYTLNDLLTFDKIDEKKLEVELHPINPWYFILETSKPFKINAKDNSIDFNIYCLNYTTKWYNSHLLHADEFKLAQVVRNLISNAIKFTPKYGKVHIQVEMIPNYPTSGILLMNSTLGNLVRISVIDTGPGIAAHNIHKLFGQYVQFNPSKLQKGGGSGLGLWISKSIVEMHGGTVRATSEGEGKGCTFVLELPLFRDPGLRGSFDLDSMQKLATTSAGDHPPNAGGRGLASLDEEITQIRPYQDNNTTTNIYQSQQVDEEALVGTIHVQQPPQPAPVQQQQTQPLRNSIMNKIFHIGTNLHQQFLNQNVKFIMNLTGSSYPSRSSSGRMDDEISSKNHYCLNNSNDRSSSQYPDIEERNSLYLDIEERNSPNPDTEHMNSWCTLDQPASMCRVNKSHSKKNVKSSSTVVPIECDKSTMVVDDRIIDLEQQTSIKCESNQSSINYTPLTLSTAISSSRHAASCSWESKLTILAVDDTALSRKMMSRLLRTAGHEVLEAEDGLECLQVMHCTAQGPAVPLSGSNHTDNTGLNTNVDIILIDENMPNMTGPEATKRLRDCGYGGLIIGVTGDCYHDQIQHFIQEGANAVLPKPLRLESLKSKLQELWSKA